MGIRFRLIFLSFALVALVGSLAKPLAGWAGDPDRAPASLRRLGSSSLRSPVSTAPEWQGSSRGSQGLTLLQTSGGSSFKLFDRKFKGDLPNTYVDAWELQIPKIRSK